MVSLVIIINFNSMAAVTVKCLYCDDFYAPSQKLLEKHIKYVHSQEAGFTIECSYDNCFRLFTNFRTYQNHLLTHKNASQHQNDVHVHVDLQAGSSNDSVFMETSQGAALNDDVIHGDDCPPNFSDYCAKWILKTSEMRKLTRTATVGIVQDVSELVKEIAGHLQHQVQNCLQAAGVQYSSITGLCDVFFRN